MVLVQGRKREDGSDVLHVFTLPFCIGLLCRFILFLHGYAVMREPSFLSRKFPIPVRLRFHLPPLNMLR